MAIQTINIGTNPNDGTGDDLRTAFDKVNDNFAELLAVGGETNTASNVGIGSTGQVFKQKNGLDFEFRTLRNTDGKLSITTSGTGNEIVINNINPDDNDIGRIQVDNGDVISATTSNALIGIKKGNTNISVTRSGSDVLISGNFNLVNDTNPQLASDLELLDSDIIGQTSGTGSNLVNIRDIDAVSLDIDTLLVNTTSTFTGGITANGSITANAGITLGSGQILSGNVDGGFEGTITGSVDLNEQTISGAGRLIIDAAITNSATPDAVGTEGGIGYRDYTLGISPFTVQTNENRPVELVSRGQVTNIPQVPLVIEHVVDTINYGAGVTQYNDGSGSAIQFAVDSTNPSQDRRLLGSISAIKVSDPLNAVIITPYDPAQGVASPPKFVFQSDGFAQIDNIGFDGDAATIGTLSSNINLKLDPSGTGTVDFYGAYQFPRTIGQAGEVLKVSTSGTVLEWGTGGGSGTVTAITAITLSNPLRIETDSAHGLVDAQQITITDVNGTTELNGNTYYADVISSVLIDLYTDSGLSSSVNGTSGFTAYAGDDSGFVTGQVTGGGAGTFVGLSDTPTSYAGAAADADKLVQVNATGNGLEFTDFNTIIDATYIEGKGFLPKGGGTMSGDINLDSNNITNGTNITTTNLFVSTIDSSDSSAITVTPGVTMNSFLTVESSLNVLDTTNTKTLTVTGNADVTGNTTIGGTLTADNFVLSGTGAPSFTSGSDIVFSAVGQLTTNAPLVPTTNNSITLGTASFKWSNVYSTTFTGDLTGNVTGNLTGQVTGDVTGSVVADDSTPLVDGVSGKLVGPVDTSTVNATNVTATANLGADTVTFTALASGPQVTVTSKFEGPWLDVDRATIGNLAIDGNNIEAGSNDIIRLRGNGTGYIDLDGNTHINGVISYANNEDITVTGTATPVTIDTDKQFSFITTSNWVSVGADFAYGNLADGTTEGQTKTIKVVSRGEFSTNGGATFTDRYLVVNLTINGASGTINVSQNSEYGAVTLVWHNSSWWIISQFDS